MKKYLACLLFSAVGASAASDDPIEAARGVLGRLLGPRTQEIRLEIIPAENGRDVFEREASDGKLVIRGSSATALCRGFYDYLQANDLGMATWAGTRLALPARWPDNPKTRVECPYQYRYYFNVVTYGYTMPYWTWERWEKELDWMALHGINLPLALVATEAIAERVWKQLGLTQEEIDEFYTGPAFLPWQRMGNINKHNGPLNADWNRDQVALQHRILARMRELGMTPILPAFAGFAPKKLARVHPEIKLHEMNWGGFRADCNAFLLAPGNPLFTEIGKLHIQEWEKEFGKGGFYLADSFNEMQVPKTEKPMPELLADYGESIYQSVIAGNPDAVWVIQGWMLFDGFWSKDNLRGLLSRVPDDKVIILNEACEYNRLYQQPFFWDKHDGFFNKRWVYGNIPNMGGKTAYTGWLSHYATNPVEALRSPNRGRLVGCGFAPEGIENNEVIYELLSDMCWRTEPVNLDTWIAQYCQNRYGGYPPEIKKAWELLRQTCYGTFTDHPQLAWQRRAFLGGTGSVNQDPLFFRAVETFLSGPDELSQSKLYQADAIELAAFYLGLKAEADFRFVQTALENQTDSPEVDMVLKHGLQLLTDTDRLLESHPTDRLQRWLEFARAHGVNRTQKNRYESDARRLITEWGPQGDERTCLIHDYAGRIWSGLIRDFYRPRVEAYFAAVRKDQPFPFASWEEKWILSSGVSKVEPFKDPVAAARKLVEVAGGWKLPVLTEPKSERIGEWKPEQISTEWQIKEWKIGTEQARNLRAVIFKYTGGHHQLDIRSVSLVVDGQELITEKHDGSTGDQQVRNTYRLTVPSDRSPRFRTDSSMVIRASVRSDGGTDSNGIVSIILR